jgi:putative FmdB family regulatory protein
MPIYAYKCESCGHSKDVLQKMSDAPLSVCPQCGAAAFKKQVTAAGFQLKGSGWYVTDFRGGAQPGAATPGNESGAAAKSGDTSPSTTAAPVTATPAASAPATPAPAAATTSSKGST